MKTKIYTGRLGLYGDIICFTPIIKKIKQLIPNSEITFAISKEYSSIKPLLERDPLINKVFVTEYFFEKLKEKGKTLDEFPRFHSSFLQGQYYDLRGDDEVEEQKKHDIVFETRPFHKQQKWWRVRNQVQNQAYNIGINLDSRETHIRAFPPETKLVDDVYIVVHNYTALFKRYPNMDELIEKLKENHTVYNLTEPYPNWVDTARMLRDAKLFIGVDSAPIWLASAFNTKTIGLYSSEFFGEVSYAACPLNPNAVYLHSKEKFKDISVDKILKIVGELLK